MARKILIGMAAVLVACLIAQAGYSFGRHLPERDAQGDAPETSATVRPAT